MTFQGVQDGKRTPATQRATLLRRFRATPWCLLITLGPGDPPAQLSALPHKEGVVSEVAE